MWSRHFPLLEHSIARWLLAYGFVVFYVFLDWASYIDPFHRLNITPWNPQPSLGILFLIQGGAGGVLTLAASMLIADVFVRSPSTSILAVVLLNMVLVAGYKFIAEAMKRVLRMDVVFSSRNSLLTWVAIVIGGTMINSMVFVSAHAVFELLPSGGWAQAMLWHWLGDGVGILVSMPLFWRLRNREARAEFKAAVLNLETVGYVLTGLLLLWVAFGLGAESSFRYFYILFLPVVWAAARQGFSGAVVSVAAMQIGMIVGEQVQTAQTVSLIEVQMRVLSLALIGFFIGVVVDEQRRAVARVKESSQLAAAGQMAGAIAHELNQPLTAISAYASAGKLLVSQESYEKLPAVMEKMILEVDRTSNVVRRIRELFSSGATIPSRFSLAELILSVTRSFSASHPDDGIPIVVQEPLPDVELFADRIQLEILLRNLFSNALDAMNEVNRGCREIRIGAERSFEAGIRIRVEDTGPGISPELAHHIFEPFFSTKSSGLGLGLAICREIAIAHGGTLTLVPRPHGCFELLIPVVH